MKYPKDVELQMIKFLRFSSQDPARMTRLDCMRSVDDNVQQALSSGIIEPG